MERNGGLRALLTLPKIYELSQSLLYRPDTHRARVARHFPSLGEGRLRVLDIGSGPAAFLAQYRAFGAFEYVALDPSERYIATARQRFPGQGTYLVGTTATIDGAALGTFDLVVADGVLHHVSDEEVVDIATFARQHLAPAGRFVTFDPVAVEQQHPISSLLQRMDRGARIRWAEEYHALLSVAFGADSVRGAVHHGQLRLPYDHYESCSSPTISATT